MKRKLLISVLFLALLSSTSITVFGQVQVGVSKGNTFTYEVSFVNNYELYTKQFWNQTYTENFRIDDISGSIVTVTDTTSEKYQGEGPQTRQYSVDLSKEQYPLVTFLPILIPSSLTVGDSFLDGGGNLLRINETVAKDFEGNSRLTNHVTFVTPDMKQTTEIYFDKQTGVLLQYSTVEQKDGHITLDVTVSPYVYSQTIMLKESSTFSANTNPSPTVPEFTSLMLIIPFLLIATLLETIVIKRKHSNKTMII